MRTLRKALVGAAIGSAKGAVTGAVQGAMDAVKTDAAQPATTTETIASGNGAPQPEHQPA